MLDYTPQNDLPLYQYATVPQKELQHKTISAKGPAVAAFVLSLLSLILLLLTPLLDVFGVVLSFVTMALTFVLVGISKRRNGGKRPALALAAWIIILVYLTLVVIFFCIGMVGMIQEIAADPEQYLNDLFRDAYGISFDEFRENMNPTFDQTTAG